MTKSATDIYQELLFEEPIACSVLAATAMRVTLDQYQEAGEKEEVTAFMERFMKNLDEISDEVLPHCGYCCYGLNLGYETPYWRDIIAHYHPDCPMHGGLAMDLPGVGN